MIASHSNNAVRIAAIAAVAILATMMAKSIAKTVRSIFWTAFGLSFAFYPQVWGAIGRWF